MTEFHDQDLTGAQFRNVDLSGAQFRGVRFWNARLRGVELCEVEISGELRNVTVNGVDIAPLVEAELDRRYPDRAKMHAGDAETLREAWAILERQWAETVERARTFPEADLHRNVGDEWSFIQTLRHLNFATAAWVNRMVLGDLSPWHPLDLPWDEAPGWDGVPWDRTARPSLDEVLTVRRERQATVRDLLAGITDAQLDATVSRAAPGWPDYADTPVRLCVHTVLNEEWEHRLYAERDLTAIAKEN